MNISELADRIRRLPPEERSELMRELEQPRPVIDRISAISSTPGVCGGVACIAGTRITVWGLEESRRLGRGDAALLKSHRDLLQADLDLAWDYVARNRAEIEALIRRNEAA